MFIIKQVSKLGLIFAAAWLCGLFGISESKIKFVNNGYEGLDVVITDTIAEDQHLIERIKEEFADASRLLFTATMNRAYFRNITIVVPKTWNTSQAYSQIPAINSFTEHIRVDRRNKARGDAPYVRGNLECGKPGWFMHLTPEFLTMAGETQYGKHESVIVQEWAHLRWGVFNEYASITHPNGDTPNQMINFYNENGSWKPVTCSSLVQGKAYRIQNDAIKLCNLNSIQLPVDCRFCPYKDQPRVRASLMATQWINTMDSFCEEDEDTTPVNVRHNSQAPNLQNKMCNGQSVWEVLNKHEDFDNASTAISATTDTSPTFRVVQETGRIRVFVFDVSGSMSGDKIIKQRQAAWLAIDNLVEIGSWLGIVSFSSTAAVRASLTEIEDKYTRGKLKDTIPVDADGGTNIYSGLQTAVTVIEGAGFSTPGSEIILLSDGQSTSYLHIIPTLLAKGILVHTIAITNAADAGMAELAEKTGGRSFTYLETESISFADVLGQAVTAGNTGKDSAEKVFSEQYSLSLSSSSSGSFRIDDGLGSHTSIAIVLSTAATVSVDITSPSNASYHADGSTDILTLQIAGIAETGEYYFVITTQSTNTITATVSMTSEPVSREAEVIRVTSRLSDAIVDMSSSKEVKLYSNIEKGGSPVFNANVTAVLASDSSFSPIHILLEDSGTGADAIASDGIYTTYLIKRYFKSNGRYNIKISVTGDGSAFTYTTTEHISSYLPDNSTSENDLQEHLCSAVQDIQFKKVQLEEFQRQSLPGEITVINYVSNLVDTTPPAQIRDLSVYNIRNNLEVTGEESITYTLSWTAVGDDMNIGQAVSYEMRMNKDHRILRNNFTRSEIVNLNLTAPKPAGEMEVVNLTLTIEDCNGTCFLGIIARDSSGLKSETSNVVNVDVDFSYEPEGDIPEEQVFTKEETTTESPQSDALDTKTISIIAAGIAAAVIVAAVVATVAVKSRINANTKKAGFDNNIEFGTTENRPGFSDVLNNGTNEEYENIRPESSAGLITKSNIAQEVYMNHAYLELSDDVLGNQKTKGNDTVSDHVPYDTICDPAPYDTVCDPAPYDTVCDPAPQGCVNKTVHHDYENLAKHNLFS